LHPPYQEAQESRSVKTGIGHQGLLAMTWLQAALFLWSAQASAFGADAVGAATVEPPAIGMTGASASSGVLQQAPPETLQKAQEISAIAARSGAYVWEAPHPRAILVAVHGMTQQGGCFDTLARRLNAEGFTVVAMDLRGHGKWFYSSQLSSRSIVSYTRSAADLVELSTSLKAAYPAVPLFCIGESVGCGVTTLAASTHPELFDGIVLASTGSKPHAYNPFLVVPDFVVGITHLHKQMDVCRYIRRYSSEDRRITSEMIGDKLSRTTLTAKEILQTAAFIRRIPSFASKLRADMPVLVIQGEHDRIVTSASAREVMRHIPSADKKMVVIPNCGHILLGTEYLKQPVVGQLVDWLVSETDASRQPIASASMLLHEQSDSP
jgi:alpha-beta hydrolase superfamily lysophospholipase